jgi:ankyrin repeat protein
MNKLLALTLLFSSLTFAETLPENIMGISCLNSYKVAYKNHKSHKAFSYAREVKTGIDRCGWGYGSETIEEAKKLAMKQCTEHNLNAECHIVDEDGKFVVKKGDYTLMTPPDNTPLTKEQKKSLMGEAKGLILGNCLPFFKDYLNDKGHKVFSYALDENGKYACGKTYQNQTLLIARNGAIDGCKTNKAKRGKNKPKSPCKIYAEGNKILFTAKDLGFKIEEKLSRDLSSDEYSDYLSKAKNIIDEGPCLFQLKYYLRGKEQQAYFLARNEKGVQACGRSEGEFSQKIAKEIAEQKCKAMVKKKKLKATCKLFAQNFDFVAKAEDFAIKKGKDGYEQALHKGNIEKVKAYIKDGFDVNLLTKKDKVSPLFLAAGKGDKAFFFELIDKGANIKHKSKDGSTLLHAAAMGGDPTIIRHLIKKGFDVNAKGREGMTPLHATLGMLHTYAVRIFMRNGADASIKNDEGISVYQIAKKWKLDLDALKKLEPNKPDYDGTLPLFYAVKAGDREGIRELLALKVDINRLDSRNYSALHIGKVEDIKFLIKLGAKVNTKDKDGVTPLMSAANWGFDLD